MPDTDLRPCGYHVIRYTPNLIRDEWVNIGVLLFDPASGRVLRRLIEEPGEFARVRRLHPAADEELLRRLADAFEAQFAGAGSQAMARLAELEQTLSNTIQLSPQKGLLAEDHDHVEAPRHGRSFEDLSTRNAIRNRANQVFRGTGIWPRLERRVAVDEFTYAGDPMRLDYAYRRNGTRGFVQTLSVTRAPADAKLLAYTVERISAKASLKTEFAAVTDVALETRNERHRFVRDTLRDVGIEPIPLEGFAVWVNKLKPLLQ
jgi:Protein of unknown function (DUF3037)